MGRGSEAFLFDLKRVVHKSRAVGGRWCIYNVTGSAL